MKKIFAFTTLLFFAIMAHSQNKGTLQVYAFQQAVLPGNIPGDVVSEDGKVVSGEIRTKYQYYIYSATSSSITPVEIWIKGKPFSASLQTVPSPVMDENPTALKKNVLVPKTSKKVQLWNPKEMSVAKTTSRGRSLSKTNDLVVVYKVSGRSYYQLVKNLKEIEPVAMQ